MVVDCKCFAENVDVKDVEQFLGLLNDVDVPLGMLVTTKAYSAAAEQRTLRVLKEVVPLVDIAMFDEVSSWRLMRAGSSGRYVGEYVDHEPYGRFWWVVSFVTAVDSLLARRKRRTGSGVRAREDGTIARTVPDC